MFVFFYERDLICGKSWAVYEYRKHFCYASEVDRRFRLNLIIKYKRDAYESCVRKGKRK